MTTQKKVMLITGAGSGIGQLTAQRALRDGWAVAGVDVNQQGLNQLGDSSDLLKLIVDVTDSQAVAEAVSRVENELGPIYRVVNAAAIMPLGRLMDQKPELINKIMAINFGGLVNIAAATLPGMLERREGEFVSYASIAAHLPIFYMGAYNASKFAVGAYTEVLYQENRNSGVQFCCVCPPPVATPLLKQAEDTVWPKIFDIAEPATAEQVVDAVDAGLAKGRFWIFIGSTSKSMLFGRKLMPSLLWWVVRKVESI